MIVLAVLLAILAIVIVSAVKVVPQGCEALVERFGRYSRTLKPGVTVIAPFIDQVRHRVSMLEQAIDIPPQHLITKDSAAVSVEGTLFIQVVDSMAAAYQVANLNQALTQLAATHLQNAVAAMDLEDLLTWREEINARLQQAIAPPAESWGVTVIRVVMRASGQ
jgi:regulator of protease activity HflC (stomatin/prohibitin superfamily)